MKKRAPQHDKRETFLKLYQSVFALEASKGHLMWKVTDLVRKSGFSRSLVYKYLGSSKPEMLQTVVTDFINEFYGISGPFKDLSLSDHILRAREIMIEIPEAIMFYTKWRAKESPIQNTFIEIELKFQKKLKVAFPDASKEDIQGYHAFLHGLVTAPFLSGEQSARIGERYFAGRTK